MLECGLVFRVRHTRYKEVTFFGRSSFFRERGGGGSFDSERMYEQEEQQPEIVPYQDIGEAYRWLANIGFNPEAIYSYVSERAGTSLPVSWPDGVSVRLVDMTRYTYFLKRYGGLCDEGECYVRTDPRRGGWMDGWMHDGVAAAGRENVG